MRTPEECADGQVSITTTVNAHNKSTSILADVAERSRRPGNTNTQSQHDDEYICVPIPSDGNTVPDHGTASR